MNREKQMQVAHEALSRATQNQALTNYPAIFSGFAAMGIPEEEILPRENVFTFHAWRALGRHVRKGEHGVRVVSFVPIMRTVKRDGEEVEETFTRPRTAYVFHVSQTEEGG